MGIKNLSTRLRTEFGTFLFLVCLFVCLPLSVTLFEKKGKRKKGKDRSAVHYETRTKLIRIDVLYYVRLLLSRYVVRSHFDNNDFNGR